MVPLTDRPSPEVYRHPSSWELALPPLTMPAMLEAAAARDPQAPLVDFFGRKFAYAAILAEARRFAAGLQACGVGKGDRIGLFLPNVPIYISAYYGAMMAGAIAVNFSPLYIAEELAQQVEDSGTQLLVTLDSARLLPTALEVLEHSSLSRLVVGRLGEMLPFGKRWLLAMFGRSQITPLPGRGDVTAWKRFLGSDEPAPVALDAETDIALLQYTGGTTGTPKGAMLTHQNLTANARQVDAIDPFRDDPDIILGVLPLFHVFANTCVLNRTIRKGGCIVMLPRFESNQVLKTIKRARPNSFPGVPTMYQALLDNPKVASTDFSSLRVCISGGAPLPQPLLEKFHQVTGAKLVEGYGLTESSGVVSTNPYNGGDRPGTIGQPIPETRIRLLDKEDAGSDPPPGEPGELAIAGPQIMQGYWNRPDAGVNIFVIRDGINWLRTGDVATIDTDGFIRIVDRMKDMIAVGGFKVFPSQIEHVLLQHDAVKEALVIGLPDPYRGETPAAFVTLNEEAEVAAEAIRIWTNQQIGKHEQLSALTIRDELPKTVIGKLDRKALRAEVLGGNEKGG
jgi:long-chain acyl-CoA synthetase